MRNQCLCLLGFVLLLQGCSGGPPARPENVCEIYRERVSWHRVAAKAAKKWGATQDVPMAIMAQESTYRARARPPRKVYLGFIPGSRPSSAFGYAQAVNGTWASYQRDTGEHWRQRDDFSDALDFINWYIERVSRTNGIKRDNAYHQYLNYHEGMTGYRGGAWKQKAWLKTAAKKVANRAENYAAQYAKCHRSLPRGWFW